MRLGSACPPWSPDEDSKLRRLWGAGCTANWIAEAIPGRSRNAVTSRAARLGLPRRPSPAVPK